ncbi:unnamed protein product [Lymnaea stagnalis]|uniref:protein-tyrosine-phosphatase n=1 Tax=Lymnaea stagnalis TaxID=6523 RepID=A0AAV2HEX3_LYMST
MIHRIFGIITVFTFSIVVLGVSAACDTGWFGTKCTYQCHCTTNTCDSNGECLEGRCASGWFGPACQYQDLYSQPQVATSSLNATNLIDRDDQTCISTNTGNLTVTLNMIYPITWIRLSVNKPDQLQVSTLLFTDKQDSVTTCSRTITQDRTMDILCDVSVAGNKISFIGDGVNSLCSLYISGGRNVAVRQMTSQSSNYSENGVAYDSSRAVDGNTDSDFSHGKCSHTLKATDSNWNVTFSRPPLVNRYVLYNRGNLQERLLNFSLSSFNQEKDLVFAYSIPPKQQLTYAVTSPPELVSYVKMFTNVSQILTLCEVEIYGDSVCPTNQFGLECNKSCNCESKAETCFVATGGCPSGCAAGFHGDGCGKNCSQGRWGVDCINQCTHCTNKTCDRINGTCDLGCEDGYKGDTCDDKCSSLTWGKDCSHQCSPQCFNKSCNITNGVCLSGCTDGYTGDSCTEACPSATWGKDCQYNCSDHCLDNPCNVANGRCDSGCEPGYLGDKCTAKCPKLTWGSQCLKRCSDHCLNKTCDFVNGICDHGCDGDYNNTQCLDESITNDSVPLAAIVAPIVFSIVVFLVIIVGVILWRRRRGKKQKISEEQVSKEMMCIKQNKVIIDNNNDDDNNTSIENDGQSKNSVSTPVTSNHENTYSNTVLPMAKDTSIAVNDLNEFMSLHNTDYFTDQFKNIPAPTNVSMEIGLSNENRHKNRYKNICTYDHSRVHLMINTAKHEGDYINASYIEGYMDKEKFIASQGPNKVIINDFVRLLWEQRVDKVVMLTNLIEEGQVKCERYWPEEGKVAFGHIKVRLASTHVFADYTIRKLELIKKDEPIHQMTQFHFTSWPDKGVPLTPWSLVDFQQRVSSEPTTSPVVVHCSAGVGRTGTFIALCNVMKEAEDTGRIDFFKTVVKLRQDRVMMIQTSAQFEFLHRAAQVAIVCMGTTVTSRDITDRIRILEEEVFKGRTKMETEFQDVCSVSEDFTKHTKDVENTEQDESVYENNVNNAAIVKNRFPDILPEKTYRASLIPDGSQSGDYINAVIVPSLKKKDQQVLTQLPLAATVVDFWRLVMDYKVSLIVEFEFHLQSTDPTIADYLPSIPGEALTLGTNEIRVLSSKNFALGKELQLSIRSKNKSTHLKSFDELKVSHLKCFSTELDVKNLLLLVKHIRSAKSPGEERVLYMCRDGAKYSGLACVLTLLLDRIDNDLRLTIPLVVGAIKSMRPQVIPTLDQYRILYQVLHRYSETTSSYTNFGDYQQMNFSEANNLEKSKSLDTENSNSSA